MVIYVYNMLVTLWKTIVCCGYDYVIMILKKKLYFANLRRYYFQIYDLLTEQSNFYFILGILCFNGYRTIENAIPFWPNDWEHLQLTKNLPLT